MSKTKAKNLNIEVPDEVFINYNLGTLGAI